MIRSAAKLGFFGVIAYFFARAFWSLFTMLAATIGATLLFGCLIIWVFVATNQGWLVY